MLGRIATGYRSHRHWLNRVRQRDGWPNAMKTILNLITQCGKTIRAPAQIIHPMTRDDAAFWELRRERATTTTGKSVR